MSTFPTAQDAARVVTDATVIDVDFVEELDDQIQKIGIEIVEQRNRTFACIYPKADPDAAAIPAGKGVALRAAASPNDEPLMVLATSDALAAGAVLAGVLTESAVPGQRARVCNGGMLPKSVTGLSAGGDVLVNGATASLEIGTGGAQIGKAATSGAMVVFLASTASGGGGGGIVTTQTVTQYIELGTPGALSYPSTALIRVASPATPANQDLIAFEPNAGGADIPIISTTTANAVRFNGAQTELQSNGTTRITVTDNQVSLNQPLSFQHISTLSAPLIKDTASSAEGVVTAEPGSMVLRRDGGGLQYKATGAGNTGWVAVGGSAPIVINRTTNGTLVGSKYAIPSARWTMLNIEIPLASGGDTTFYAQLPAAPTEGDIVEIKCLMETGAGSWDALLSVDGNGITIEIPAGTWDHTGAIGTMFASTLSSNGQARNACYRLVYVGGRWRVTATYQEVSASHLHGKRIDWSNGGGADVSATGDALIVSGTDMVPHPLFSGRSSKALTTFDANFPALAGSSNGYSRDGHVYATTTDGTQATLCSLAGLPGNAFVDIIVSFVAIDSAAVSEFGMFAVDARARFYVSGVNAVTQVGSTTLSNQHIDNGSWVWAATIDNTAGGAPRLRITGQTATTIRWGAEVTVFVRTTGV